MTEPSTQRHGLRWWHAVLGLVILILCLTVIPGIVMAATGGVSTLEAGGTPTVPGWLVLVQFGLMALLALGALTLKHRRRPGVALTELRAPTLGPVAIVGIGVGAGIAFALLWQLYAGLTGGEEASKTVTMELGIGRGTVNDILLIIGVVAVGPLAEEIVFRGMVFRGVRDQLDRSRASSLTSPGVLVGGIVAAVLFAGAHSAGGQASQFVPLLVLGLVSVVLYQLTGSLAVTAVEHSVSNAVGLGFMLYTAGGPGQAWHAPVIIAAPFVTVALLFVLRQLRARRRGEARRSAPTPRP